MGREGCCGEVCRGVRVDEWVRVVVLLEVVVVVLVKEEVWVR